MENPQIGYLYISLLGGIIWLGREFNMEMEKEIDKLNAKVILGSDDKTTFVKQAKNAMKNLYS